MTIKIYIKMRFKVSAKKYRNDDYKMVWIIVILLFFSSDITAGNIYVDPHGNDNWSGRSEGVNAINHDGPFRTIVRAQKEVRRQLENQMFPIIVYLSKGTHHVNSTVVFDSSDSGSDIVRKVTWTTKYPGKSIVSGGAELNECKKITGELWSCSATKQKLRNIDVRESWRIKGEIPRFNLYVDGVLMHLARWPNKKWAHISNQLEKNRSFISLEKLPELSGNLKGSQIHIWPANDWFDEYHRVSEVSKKSNSIRIDGQTTYPIMGGRRYYLCNILTELDSPGEWYFDTSNEDIRFIPPNKSTVSNIVATKQSSIFKFYNAENIIVDNLVFKYANKNAIEIIKSSNIVIKDCEINSIRGKAIAIRKGKQNRVVGSYLHHLGQGGVLVKGGDRSSLKKSNHQVYNTHIANFSEILRTKSAAIDVNGVGAIISNNLVHDGTGCGIYIKGNDHLIEKNELHSLCTESADCGAIYSGRNWTYRGNIIRYNSIHNIYGYGLEEFDKIGQSVEYISPKDTKGIYLDDRVSGFNVFGNVLYKAGTKAIQVGGGRDNTINNNVIVTDYSGLWIDDRWPEYNWEMNYRTLTSVPHNEYWKKNYPGLFKVMMHKEWPEGNTIKNNIIVTNNIKTPIIRYILPEHGNTISNNIIWSDVGEPKVTYKILDGTNRVVSDAWSKWVKHGIEKNSMNSDPCLYIQKNKVIFCNDSKVETIGYSKIPDDIGLVK